MFSKIRPQRQLFQGFCWDFLITASVSLGVICLFRFSDSSWLSLEDCMFLGIYPFCPGCPVCRHIVVHSIFLKSFVFLWCHCYFFSFISDFIYLGLLSLFFLMGLVKVLSILFIFSKNQFWDLLICIIFLDCILLISVLIFIISFLLLSLGFVVLFSSSFKCKVRLFIWAFPYAMNFPLRVPFPVSHRL